MSVLLIVKPKCTLAALHGVNMLTGQTDRRTNERQTITLRFPLGAAGIIRCNFDSCVIATFKAEMLPVLFLLTRYRNLSTL